MSSDEEKRERERERFEGGGRQLDISRGIDERWGRTRSVRIRGVVQTTLSKEFYLRNLNVGYSY